MDAAGIQQQPNYIGAKRLGDHVHRGTKTAGRKDMPAGSVGASAILGELQTGIPPEIFPRKNRPKVEKGIEETQKKVKV